MISITVELLTGVIRANSGEALAGSANTRFAEWPPSPARLFAAMVSGGGSGSRNQIGSDDSELRLLESAPPPLIAASSTSDVLVSSIQERYVVLDDRAENRVQEYPARKAGLVRPGDRSAPRSPFITYIWPELEPNPDELAALESRSARIAYLGSSDSPVRVSVNRNVGRDRRQLWRPDDSGTRSMPVPYVGYLAALDRSYEAFSAGASQRGTKVMRARVAYRDPDGPAPQEPEAPTIWTVFDAALPAQRALAVGEAIRGLVLTAYTELFGEPPSVLHGHGVKAGEQHARYVPLADVGYRYSKGKILGAAIWLPAGTPREVVGNVRVALASSPARITLAGGTTRAIRLRPPGRSGPWACHPNRWLAPATEFSTVFPAVHQRFGTVNDPLATVGMWCRDAGLPSPVDVELSRSPFLNGVPRFGPHDLWREKSTKGYPFSHVRLRFDEPVSDLAVIGRGRSFGLGLLAPNLRPRFPEDEARDRATQGEHEEASQ